MATLPEANLTISESSGSLAGAGSYCVVMGCVGQSADSVPRVMSSTKGLLAQYGYAPAVDYAALHFLKTRLPVIFIGLPIVAAGSVGSLDTSGVVGSSVVTVTPDVNGFLEETYASFTVTAGQTVGTDQIAGVLSLDGGVTSTPVRVGTANTYTIPNVGAVLNFAAGTLLVGDVVTWRTKPPMWNGAGITAARNALAGQQNLSRSWMVVGDLPNSTLAGNVRDEANNYFTSNQRFVYARTQVADLLPLAKKSRVLVESLTFVASAETCTRTAGSFLKDGFAAGGGESVLISGTADNNGTLITASVTDTVMTFTTGAADETILSHLVSMTKVETLAAWMSAQSAAFATIDASPRIDIAAGKARITSPITGYAFRRPAAWAASLREYGHDVQIPCWRKDDGPLDGFSMTDANGNIVEFDERFDGGGLAGRFTVLRTYANGPLGAFVALSLTRDSEGALLSRTHNEAVTNLGCTVVQATTENAIGQVLVLNPDGTGTEASLSLIEGRVNKALQINLLQSFKEGPRASSAVWAASRTDVLSTVGATLNGVLSLLLNGTLEQINTSVAVS